MATFAIVGAGFVADFYMRSAEVFPQHSFTGVWDRDPDRLARFSTFWNIPAARGLDDLFRGPKRPDILLNLTDPQNHYEVSRAALEAGLHVYSEAPFATSMADAHALVDVARQKALVLSSAPCNGLSAAAQATWLALRRRLVGVPHLVYAEMDNGYVPQAPYERWVSESGAPWPARNAFDSGTTLEHAGYCLSWLLAMFGPVRKLQAVSGTLIKDKFGDGTPSAADYSVGLMTFDNDVMARLTNSIVATHDHRFRVFGSLGLLAVDNVWDNNAKVKLLRRNAVRRRLVEGLIPERVDVDAPSSARGRGRSGDMNYMLGPHDIAQALAERRDPRLSTDYALHLNEVTLAIHGAGDGGVADVTTTFEPLTPMPWARPKQRRRAMTENVIKLGIVGTGAMAATMRDAMRHEPRIDVTAVCASTLARAEQFAMEHEVENAYGDLEAMLAIANLDAVYIANATRAHTASAIAALDAGKATLVEKPFAMNVADAERVLAAANASGALFMEGLWTAFLPSHARALELAKGGTVGEPVHLSMEVGYPATPLSAPRLFDAPAGGGVLLDRMIYPLGLALTLFGPVMEMDAAVTVDDGIDTHASLQLRHEGGGTSQVSASLITLTANMATISCTGGLIRIEEPVLGSETITVRAVDPVAAPQRDTAASTTAPPPGQAARAKFRSRLNQSGVVRRVNRAVSAPRSETLSYGVDPYHPMLSHFADLASTKRTESDVVTHDLSLAVQRLLQRARTNEDTSRGGHGDEWAVDLA